MEKIFFLCFFFVTLSLFSQTKLGEERWAARFGQQYGDPVKNCRLVEDVDGSIVMVGQLKEDQVYFARINPLNGTIITEQVVPKLKAIIHAIVPVNGGFLAAGTTASRKGHAGLWFVDNRGAKWESQLEKTLKNFTVFHDLKLGGDGNFFVTGQKDDRLCLLKINQRFEVVGEPFVKAGPATSTGMALALTPNGDVFVTGHEEVKRRPQQLLLLKFNAKAQQDWEKRFDQVKAAASDLIVADDGDIVITGTAFSAETQEDLLVAKVDRDGIIKWLRTYGGVAQEMASCLMQTPDRHLLVGGRYFPWQSFMSNTLLYLINRETGNPLDSLTEGDDWMDWTDDLLRLTNNDILAVHTTITRQDRKPKPWLVNYPHSPCEVKLTEKENFYFSRPAIYPHEYIENDNFVFRGTLVSKYPLEELDFRIRNNGSGVKGPGVFQLNAQETYPDQHCYFLEKSLQLDPGNNLITMRVEKNGQAFHDSISVFHFPERPNLHLLSIGVITNDLDYTDEDAADFARLFREQEGKLFKKVYTTILETRELTTADRITDEIFKLKDQYEGLLPVKVNPEDVLIIFISSHGQMLNDEFVIPASDFRPDNERTYIKFEQDLLQVLERVPCKKLIFLDACKSGGAKDANSPVDTRLIDNILRIADTAPGVTIFSSCSKDESSYEHIELQNSFFTEAIIEALSSESEQADTNQDQVISLEELYEYVHQRVPDLVYKLYRNPNKKQTPTMPDNQLNERFPVFYLGKEVFN